MKLFSNTYKLYILIASIIGLGFMSCKDDLPSGIDSSDKFSSLEAIRLINAGTEGNLVLEGTIDHDKKEINFPRIDPETDFSKLRFEIDAASGARLEQESYEVQFQEGQSARTIVLK
ncbi:MAG TPA: DUF4623 domain-containing protein, partial [Sphingobacterium sp.]|nr:DUF4623 domain-containing protein [Sphingobacterium sp.]